MVLDDLRRSQRRRRIEDFDVGEAVYKVYVTAIVGGISVWFAAQAVGGRRVAPHVVAQALLDGPRLVGACVAAVVLVGLRSGLRGGPLALESAFVRHVLLAPVDRNAALRVPAWRLVRFGSAAASGVGAVAGLLAYRRLGGNWAAWVACGAAVASLAVGAGLGTAMLVSGRGTSRRSCGVVATVVVAWSLADVLGGSSTSPATLLGEIAFWPLRLKPVGLVGAAVAVGVVLAGVASVGGTSLEASARRASLVGLIRFAVTVRDLRTVVLLRRQLAQETPRRRPWLGNRTFRWVYPGSLGTPPPSAGAALGAGAAVGAGGRLVLAAGWTRAWRGILRFPAGRLARVAALSVIAGAAAYGVWDGTTPLIFVAGLALFVAGLDVTEPLAQAVDHPWATDSYPHPRGALMLALLPACAVAMVAVGFLGAIAAWALSGAGASALEVAAVVWVPASLAGVAGAAISTIQGAQPTFKASDFMLPPEFLGARIALRLLWPPLVSTAGLVPLLAARSARSDPAGAAASASLGVVVLLAVVALWVRHHDTLHQAVTASLEAPNGPGRR